jgi:hypothetical protein
MKSDETFEYSDDDLYLADDVYGATSDFWGDEDDEDSSESSEQNPSSSGLPDHISPGK